MKPVGIVSIPREQTPSPDHPFDELMAAAGHNTGNLLFTNAVWEQIDGPKKRIGFSFNPETVNKNCSALVFPAANWFGAHVDFSSLANLVERLDVPVTLIGLGAQDDHYSGSVSVPEGTLRFVRAVSERSHSVSVRGAYTRKVLETYGIRNVTVTGCPSLYPMEGIAGDKQLLRARSRKSGAPLLHATRYSAGYRPFIEQQSLHRELFRLALHSKTPLLYQSEPEEISLLVEAQAKPELGPGLQAALEEIYRADSWTQLLQFIRSHGHVFFDVSGWKTAMEAYRFVFGTRLHATIMALNSGVPALLAHHDSRTREVSEFAAIPAIAADSDLADMGAIEKLLAEADLEGFVRQRAANRKIYEAFLADNLLPLAKDKE